MSHKLGVSFLCSVLIGLLSLACTAPEPCDGVVCKSGEVCKAGQCVLENTCSSGEVDCGGSCVDVQTSNSHCGGCGNVCGSDEACKAGKCETGNKCKAGETDCNGNCADIQSDKANCGGCGNVCQADETCKAGKCEANKKCQPGETDCNGSCVNIQSDKANCGGCGNVCQTDETCKAGKCEANKKCQPGETDCSGSCVDVQTNKNHCGGCGNVCGSDEACKAGKCEVVKQCPSGQTNCNGTCVDTQSDKANCGSCGGACLPSQSCSTGVCECPTKQTECNKTCVDTQSDKNNCGACVNVCRVDQVCQGGQCECSTGQTNCSGLCVDMNSDKAHCGACGNVCKNDELCTGAKCIKLQPYLYAAQRSRNSSVGINAVLVDRGGNAFITGGFANEITFGTNLIKGKRSFDVFVAKLDAQGQLAWVTRLGQDGSDIGFALALDSVGNLYVVGHEPRALYAKDTNRDILFVKLDPTGKLLMRKVPGSTKADIAYGVAVDAKDHVWLTGTVGSPGNFGSLKIQAAGSQGFVAKATPKGDWEWVKGLGSVGSVGRAIAVDKAGNGYITGNFSGTLSLGSTKLTSQGKSDIFVIKYAVNGDVLWATSGGGVEDDTGLSLAVDGVGDVYVTGRIKGDATLGSVALSSKGDNDIFVAKLSTRGQWRWAKSAGGAGNDLGAAIALDPAGHPFITGSFSQSIRFGSTQLNATKSTDFFLAKLDPSGNWLSAQSGGGDGTDRVGDDFSNGVSVDPNGNAYVIGTVRSAIRFQGLTAPKKGADQVLVSRVMAGTCSSSCASGSACCNGTCRKLDTDATNCGACFKSCPINGICQATKCSCPSGETNCGLTCTNTQNDFQHCGACGKTCPVGGRCQAGTCVCPSGETECNGVCVDIQNDKNHCGACGKICGTGQLCQGGTCVCPTGQDFCGNACVDISENISHCGKCGNACARNNICVDKVCKSSYWVKGSSGAVNVTSAAIDGTGHVYAAGGFASSAAFSTKRVKSKGSSDAFVVKFDSAGVVKELISFGGTSTDSVNDISVSSSGDVYITGYFRDSATFGTTTLTGKGREDIFVAKLDKDLKLLKIVTFGTTRDEQGMRIAIDATGNVFVALHLEGSDTLTLGTASAKGPTATVLKMDKDLKVIKAVSAKGANRYSVTGLAVDSTGDVFVTFNAYVSSTGTTSVNMEGGASVTLKGSGSSTLKGVVVRLDNQLKPLKIASATDKNLDELADVASDGKGNIYVTGSAQQNVTVAQLDKDLIWGKVVTAQGAGFDKGTSIALDGQTNVYVSCSIRSAALTFDNMKLPAKGGDDMLMLKLDNKLNSLRAVRGLSRGTDTANDIVVVGGDFYIVGSYAKTFTVKGKGIAGSGAYVTKNLP